MCRGCRAGQAGHAWCVNGAGRSLGLICPGAGEWGKWKSVMASYAIPRVQGCSMSVSRTTELECTYLG